MKKKLIVTIIAMVVVSLFSAMSVSAAEVFNKDFSGIQEVAAPEKTEIDGIEGYLFDRANLSYLSVPDFAFDFSKPFTLGFFVKLDASMLTGFAALVGFDIKPSGSHIEFYLANGNFAVYAPGSNTQGFDTGVALEADKLTHVAFVYDGSTMSFYLDGEAKFATNIALAASASAEFTLGALPQNWDFLSITGFIGDYRLFDSVFTATDVAALKDGTYGKVDPVEEAKVAALAEIKSSYDGKVAALATDAAKNEAKAAYDRAVTAIEAATTVDGVNTSLANGKAAIAAVVDNQSTSDVFTFAVMGVVVLMGAAIVIKRKVNA